MKIPSPFAGYDALARKIAAGAGARVDALMTRNPRRVRTETNDAFLGGDAWPGALAYARVSARR
jgi:hypothetical protein